MGNVTTAQSTLGALMHELMAVARSGDAARCHEPMAGTTRQVEGLRSEGRFGDLSIVIDEPVAFGGTGLAPNPAEVALAALGASIEVTLRCYAEYHGIPVDSISVDLAGALDNRGFFGADPTIRPGFPRIDVRINVGTAAPAADVARLIAEVERCCPVLDLFRNATHIDIAG
ncbi:MAG: OsmC family protein [Sphingosinicella sp.]|nr:OsmC family protein [Sphingosinicella sp.]